ncbi:MAG: DUF2779 domain-containing protein [Proteobacteria bacterium]|nr:DUF2779 domain-containing protein [Pseudomonadota bacterium]
MSGRRVYLSKSRLMSARQCLKRLHLEVHQPELMVHSAATQAAFNTGHAVGEVAQQLYGNDDAVVIPYEGGMGKALKKTARLVSEGPRYPIFEATFQHGGVLVRVDALLPDGDAWRIVEVKASTSVKDEHVFDCAAQRWVVEGSGHELTGIALAHVDNTFVYAGEGDFDGLLIESDQTESTDSLLGIIPEWISKAQDAASGAEPAIGVGAHCFKPYECPFVSRCWPSNSEYPVQGLGGGKAKLGAWIAEGIEDIRDVPVTRLSEKQQWIQTVTRSGQAELLPGAGAFVASLEFPRYYLDFETIMPAIPIWAGTRPYETLPIQFSCHYETAPGVLEHADFLDLSGDPPMRRLAESMIRALGKEGPVLMYTSYERTVISGLIERFPDLEEPLQAIIDRLVDLHPPTQQFYYHPAMAGSWSLKAVLPTIAADMRYSELQGIQEGTAASEGYLEAMQPDTSPERKAELKEQLLQYCKFDTAALVRLVQFMGKGN